MIELGDEVKDSITGFQGVVVGAFHYLHGCRRLAVQPRELKDGKPLESQVFDEPQLILVKAINPPVQPVKTGGPHDDPPSRDPSSIRRTDR